uniref:BHLH domain-containing protein n=1 Tax=Cucumis melo TaxID=3656 RepID=A0A9I9CS70_CUCME
MMECSYEYERMKKCPHDYTLDELNFPAKEKVNNLRSSSQLVSFGDYSGEIENYKFDNYGNLIGSGEKGHEIKKDYCSTIIMGQLPNRNRNHNNSEHVIAERRRREKIRQNFIALSALIPGLIKRDKASVLGGAIEYVKELQERLKWAEEEAEKQKSVIKSVVFVKRINLDSDDSENETFSLDENGDRSSVRSVPTIEIRVLEKDVMVRIHCKKRQGCYTSILSQIEKLKLTILNSCVSPFGESRLDITIVAEMEAGFCMTPMDVGKNLRETLVEFI